jgi:alpha-L-arabinofuranosidase
MARLMMRLPFLIFAVCGMAFGGGAAEVNYRPLVPEVQMPDGTRFLTWTDETSYTRTYHVSENDPRASDENPGTHDRPFRTVNHAAQVVRPTERVWIHAGVYRELVQPRFSGEGSNRMIAYEAAPGEQVIIKGSRVLQTRWERSRDPHGEGLFSEQLWMTTLPDALFSAGYFPFRTPNISNEEFALMPWALSWKDRIPYSLPRGMVFQEGDRMVQLASYEDLVRLPGSYWVAPDGKTLHIHPFGSRDPNGKLFEIAVQSHIFRPQEQGTGFVRVSGLIMEQCANGLARVGVGALNVWGGHHWIIERNTICHVNSVGIEIGYRTFEDDDKTHPRREDPPIGHNIVRCNRVQDCGTAGIRSLTTPYALVEDNEITHCGWQYAEFHWEVAGIKLLINTGSLVRHNHIAHLRGSGGIWLDWDNANSRVTGNMIHDISTAQGAIFVEASQRPNLVDDNVIWNIDGQGVRAADTDELVIAHNLFADVTEDLVFAKVATTRFLDGRKLTSTGNRVVNNIFIDSTKPLALDTGNFADYNVYVSTGGNTAGVGPAAGETHSLSIKGNVHLDTKQGLLTWKPAQALPPVPEVTACDQDFAGRSRKDEHNVPGPFLSFSTSASVRLRDLCCRASSDGCEAK